VRFLELEDVILLLRSEVERAGGQAAWSKKTSVNRSVLNRVLNGRYQPTLTIIKALKLRPVFVPGSPRLSNFDVTAAGGTRRAHKRRGLDITF
jgi:hypothetical protein